MHDGFGGRQRGASGRDVPKWSGSQIRGLFVLVSTTYAKRETL